MKRLPEMKNDGKDFERFDDVMTNLLAVPYSKLQDKLEEEKREKEKKKGLSTLSSSARVSRDKP